MRALCRFTLAAVLAVAPFAMASAQAVAQWNKTAHDFGLFHETDGDQTCHFMVTNTGDSALVVLRVQPTCGCTVAKFPTDPILPGESGTIDVTYSPTGRPGPFEKGVWVYTNSSPRRTHLTIQGSVICSIESVKQYYPINVGDLQFTTLTMSLGEIKKGTTHTCSTAAYNTGNDTILLSFDNNTSHITSIAVSDTLPPGMLSTMSFFFDSGRTPVWGINDDYITIIATPLHSNKAPQHIKANIIANVVEDFSALSDKDRVNAPVCSVMTGKMVLENMRNDEITNGTLKLQNTGKSNLIVRRVMSTDKAIKARIDKTLVKPGEEASINIKVNPAKVSGKVLNSQITVISNDPVNPRITIPIVGTIIP
jgi:hypothetical protein